MLSHYTLHTSILIFQLGQIVEIMVHVTVDGSNGAKLVMFEATL